MAAFGKFGFGLPLTIANAKFDEDEDEPDPDYEMECEEESDSSEMMSSQGSNRPPELSPYASPVKADVRPQFVSSVGGRERRQLFTTPTKEFAPFSSSMRQQQQQQQQQPRRQQQQQQSSPFTSPVKLRPVFDYPNDSFPALEFQTPEKKKDSYESPVKTGFGFGPRLTPEKLSYGCYLSPVKAPYESETYASHRPFTYADLLPQHEEVGVAIHRRTRHDSTSSNNEGKALFFPVPGVRLQDMHDWSTTPKMEGQDLPASPLKSKIQAHTGHLVEVNGTKVALFRFGTHVFGINEKCPHAGGPLHVGDIEVLPDMSICVRCPWHGWKFDLMNGKARRPLGREQSAAIYPVKISEDGSLQIGFDHFDPKLLMDEF